MTPVIKRTEDPNNGWRHKAVIQLGVHTQKGTLVTLQAAEPISDDLIECVIKIFSPRPKVEQSALFRKNNSPIAGLTHALDQHDCASLEELQERAAAGKITPDDIYRLKGNGTKFAPGRLARYLFDL